MAIETVGQGGFGAVADADLRVFKEPLFINRAPGQTIDPAQFVRWLWEFKHPRWVSIGVESNRWGNNPRESVGIGPCGTVWAANDQVKEYGVVVPCDCLPFTSIASAEWSEDMMRFVGGAMVLGWRPALELLLDAGFLRGSRKLSYLIGKDSVLRNHTTRKGKFAVY